jgi:hypothetical protein
MWNAVGHQNKGIVFVREFIPAELVIYSKEPSPLMTFDCASSLLSGRLSIQISSGHEEEKFLPV